MRSLALETINVNNPADQWLEVFTDGSYMENQVNLKRQLIVVSRLVPLRTADCRLQACTSAFFQSDRCCEGRPAFFSVPPFFSVPQGV
ncbi:unnamed protein product [Rodentolepis nana]|uniref:RNase H domain-containing protein n=1 Tax=Rodentolepis nana TaxID=102285 RepID=A0A0R3TXA7_RODNA|nr:unnamed protein product [Rodentolepis nana]